MDGDVSFREEYFAGIYRNHTYRRIVGNWQKYGMQLSDIVLAIAFKKGEFSGCRKDEHLELKNRSKPTKVEVVVVTAGTGGAAVDGAAMAVEDIVAVMKMRSRQQRTQMDRSNPTREEAVGVTAGTGGAAVAGGLMAVEDIVAAMRKTMSKMVVLEAVAMVVEVDKEAAVVEGADMSGAMVVVVDMVVAADMEEVANMVAVVDDMAAKEVVANAALMPKKLKPTKKLKPKQIPRSRVSTLH
ncbi:Hypothetical predicted protein [Olea europaea subsp. europaea]|uniref:Uncharacterized protein n=1 Tax=Olea europaea subsp. europaea TaxID=158383 RepID=A0A8S0SFY0_OLEEU|nr:Hypothetical predicted protein [Olea europaea subsp. europaea]